MKLQLVACHRKAERSFFWKGKQFPVCARCTGIYLGYLSFPIFNFDLLILSNLLCLGLMIPTILDGLTQAFFKRKSTNLIRVVSGLVAGIGGVALMVNTGTFIGNIILK